MKMQPVLILLSVLVALACGQIPAGIGNALSQVPQLPGGFPGVGSLSPTGGSDSGSSSSNPSPSSSNPSPSPSGSVKPPGRFPGVGKQQQQQVQQPNGGAPSGGYPQPQRPSRGQGRQSQA